MGSGVIVSPDGYVVTNNHVVDGAGELTVTLPDKREFKGKVVGTDPKTDLAVVKIDAHNLPYANWGDSSKLEVGEYVLAIGNPFGLNSTVTLGIVSALGRGRMGITQYEDFIQTDAAINPGNSGGPLMNGHGEVIGINTMILSNVGQNAGIGFAIPINAAKAVLNDLVTLGRVRRPALGVSTIPVGPELAEQMGLPVDFGLLIVKVLPGQAAERAGLRGGSERAYLGNIPIMLGGDLIVAIDGQNVQDQQDLAQVMNAHRAGDTVKVTVYRAKQKLEVTVTLGEAREQV
jgi:S1-C subfamily serine protease